MPWTARIARARGSVALHRSAPLALLLLALGACSGSSETLLLRFETPRDDQLSQAGTELAFTLQLPDTGVVQELVVRLNGEALPADSFELSGRQATGAIADLPEGAHELTAEATIDLGAGEERSLDAATRFEAAALEDPQACEILNQAECLLPYPSSRFLETADTPTGRRLAFPEEGMPFQFGGERISPEPYRVLDGFSPTVQVLMHFPGAGVDLEASGASRLLEETRTSDARSVMEDDSPTLLIDAETGERILHWLEPDARAENPERQTLFLRPGVALEPGRRYIVAIRDLVDRDGEPVQPEPVFTVFRDERPTDIDAVEARREQMETLFEELAMAGVVRDDLLLAFDFAIQSEAGLTAQMQAMRDETFESLAAEGPPGFTVEAVSENDCSEPDAFLWREVIGVYEVPLYLDTDPEETPQNLSFLAVDDGGQPVVTGTTEPPFTIAIPCSVLEENGAVQRPLLMGHGLFGTGRSFVRGLFSEAALDDLDFIAGATDFRGLSNPDIDPEEGNSVIVTEIFLNFDNFASLPDRLRQGQLNTLVLAHMMKEGLFNEHEAFQRPDGTGVFPGPSEEMYYFGASLGGIMGTMFAALTPDVDKLNVDVPGMNFSLLIPRATPFLAFEPLMELINPDPMQQALLLGLTHELWVRGEPAGYVAGLAEELASPESDKGLLITVAWLDQQVTNHGAEIMARTLGVPNLEGSVQPNLPEIPDMPGPLDSAFVVYDTGNFDPDNPAHEPFIPPLANLQAEPSQCDPHFFRGFIPASLEQLLGYFQPGGRIENFCAGFCDASTPFELPFGAEEPCDPLED